MKKIVVINGTGGAGKDTFVNLCSNYKKVQNTSSIDLIKDMAILCGWNNQKDEKSRKFLSDLKDLVSDYNDAPYKEIENQISKFYNSDNEILFIHIREPENIDKIARNFDAKTLLITRLGLSNIQSNHADKEVNNYKYDFYIYNDGSLEDFKSKAKHFVETLEVLN